MWGVVVTRDNSVTKAHTRHPRGERARVGGGHGRTEERERGADWSRLHGGDFMAHSAGVEDITEVMRRRGVRRHRAHTPRFTGATPHACSRVRRRAAGAGALGGVGGGEVRARLRLRVGLRLCQLRLERGAFVTEEGRDRLLGIEISLLQSVAAELT